MKPSVALYLLLPMLLLGCATSTSKDEIKEAIPGTYIRASQHEFGTEHDTVVISLQNEAANEYSLTRKWKYERVLDGKAIEPEYKNTTTTAIYDANGKLLKETQTGDTYTFDAKQGTLFAGSTKYQKLK